MPKYNLDEYLYVTHELSENTKNDKFGIPFIEIQDFPFEDINYKYPLVNYNNCLKSTFMINEKIAHGFMYDERLETLVKHPIKFLKKVGLCKAWITPDFSIDMNASEAQAIGVIEKNRWIGRLGQEYGQVVIPSIAWSREELDYICFAGLRNGGIFAISTLGVDNDECRDNFFRGFNKMKTLFPNSKIICLGNKLKGMPDDIIYIPYNQSFGSEKTFQIKLFSELYGSEVLNYVK